MQVDCCEKCSDKRVLDQILVCIEDPDYQAEILEKILNGEIKRPRDIIDSLSKSSRMKAEPLDDKHDSPWTALKRESKKLKKLERNFALDVENVRGLSRDGDLSSIPEVKMEETENFDQVGADSFDSEIPDEEKFKMETLLVGDNYEPGEDPIGKFKCNMCEKSFATQTHHRKHKIAKHPDRKTLPDKREKIYDCELCGETLKSLEERIVHENNHLLNLNGCQCPVCGIKVCSKLLLTKHIHLAHGNERNCIICQAKFKHWQTMANHIMKEHYEESKSCCICREPVF